MEDDKGTRKIPPIKVVNGTIIEAEETVNNRIFLAKYLEKHQHWNIIISF